MLGKVLAEEPDRGANLGRSVPDERPRCQRGQPLAIHPIATLSMDEGRHRLHLRGPMGRGPRRHHRLLVPAQQRFHRPQHGGLPCMGADVIEKLFLRRAVMRVRRHAGEYAVAGPTGQSAVAHERSPRRPCPCSTFS